MGKFSSAFGGHAVDRFTWFESPEENLDDPHDQVIPPVPTGSEMISEAQGSGPPIPDGCPCSSAPTNVKQHSGREMEKAVADLTRNAWMVRKEADGLHLTTKDKGMKELTEFIGKYASNVEFMGRQVAYALRMPISVGAPYLPIQVGTAVNMKVKIPTDKLPEPPAPVKPLPPGTEAAAALSKVAVSCMPVLGVLIPMHLWTPQKHEDKKLFL
eukprot:GEMP01023183.1.p1 GENE.GEMP01023183.1~~GEMP01023183.1.p1  ORF type:complete len:213 (+),score=48.00 GEMP01023183.1:100-738(+)